MNCCCQCGRNISGTGWLCNGCAKETGVAGVEFAAWPDWLKMFATQEQQERRRDAVPIELTFSDCPEAEVIAYGEID